MDVVDTDRPMSRSPARFLPPVAAGPAERRSPVSNVLETIGQTPLVQLNRLAEVSHLRVFAKLEFFNPGGSLKDRPARRMLEMAMAEGRIGRDTLVVESSSGNMGIGLAQFCRYHGLQFRCVIDPRIQPQNLAILKAYGAQIDRVELPDPETGDFLVARLRRVREIVGTMANCFWPNQYVNRDNSCAHRMGTMGEIDEALDGAVDYLFVATSTTGTAGGCVDYLRANERATRTIAVDAQGSVLFGGSSGTRKIPGLGAGVVPDLALGRRFSEVVRVSDLDCVIGARRLVEREGILAGGSAGGVVEAVRRLAPTLTAGSTCVAILADGGSRYLDTVYNDDWVERETGCCAEELKRRIQSSASLAMSAVRPDL